MKNYRIVNTAQDIEELFEYIQKHQIISYDIETNSVEEKLAQVIGIGLSGAINEGWYIPLRKWNNITQNLEKYIEDETDAEELQFIKDLHDLLLSKKIIGHNLVFDVSVIYHSYGINLTPAIYSDTILLKHTVDEERPFGLKEIVSKYALVLQEKVNHLSLLKRGDLPFTASAPRKIKELEAEVQALQHFNFGEYAANQEQLDLKASILANGGRWTKEHKDMYKGDTNILGTYCASDTDLTYRLYLYLSEILKREELENFFYNQEVMPLYKKATIPMRMKGIYVDVEYFKALEKELKCGIMDLETKIFDKIEDDIAPLVKEILDKEVQVSRTGKFAEKALQHYGIKPPINQKTGKPTFAKKELLSLSASYPDHPVLQWLTFEACKTNHVDSNDATAEVVDPAEPHLPKKVIYEIKKEIYLERHPSVPRVFNLSSNQHIAWLIFKKYGEKAESFSKKTNAAKVDADVLEKYTHLPFVADLLSLKKEEKLLNTYIKPILEKQIDGWLYPSMLQFGTSSGRYSCAGGLNLQTLPRDDERIKRGFIAPPGYKIVNADFASLEPRCFAMASKDPDLLKVYRDNLDLYSQIAIDVFNLKDVSAKEDDHNYLKNKDPEIRQKMKATCLAVVYGANAWRIADMLKITPEEAEIIIEKYLNRYPYLKDYMENQEILACKYGKVKTQFGRVRHLPEAKTLHKEHGNMIFKKWLMKNSYGEEGEALYYKFRNYMNLAKNFPIQATAAHITNNAMIKLADLFVKEKIEGHLALQIHDELCCIVREDHAEKASELLKEAMENNPITQQLTVPIVSNPKIADNLKDAK